MEQDNTQYIQAFISNLTYYPGFDQFKAAYISRESHNLEALLKGNTILWSVPRWSHQNDIILFMYSKKSIQKINAIAKKVEEIGVGPRRRFSNYVGYSKKISEAKEQYKKYGGKIVGFGRLMNDPELSDYYYRTQTGASIGDIYILENPLPASEFTSFLRISQGGVTPVWGEWYEKIKQMIIDTNNNLPDYFLESVSMTEEQASINGSNWLQENLKINFNYKKEEAFRTFYVDYLLKEISDDGQIYTECACYKIGLKSPSYADYFISMDSKWLPVETKIDINIEKDIDSQVRKYCDLTEVVLNPVEGETAALEDLVQTKVLIIDERKIQLYDHKADKRSDLVALKELTSEKTVQELRSMIINNL